MMVKKEEQSPSQCRETMVDSQSTEANSELEQENAASGQNQGGPKPTTLDVSRANEQGGGEEVHGANDAGNSQGTGPTEEDSDSSSMPSQVEVQWRRFIDLGRHRPWSIDLSQVLGERDSGANVTNEANEVDDSWSEANEWSEISQVNDAIEVGQADASQVVNDSDDVIEDVEDTLTAAWRALTMRPRWASGQLRLMPPSGPIDLA